ncbi:MAG: copper amine oxidase N-terminal domain-containing protein [Bacillota bacterium]|nr:copper amine oxidase N-terminal domain-containing protein [Bacillota bacterium]
MKIRKIISVMLIAAMVLSFGMSASAEDITMQLNSTGHTALSANSGPIGLYVNMNKSFNSVSVICPSMGNNIGTLHFGIYLWDSDYASTTEGDELYGKSFVDFKDNDVLKFDFPTAPAGEYLILITSVGTDAVGCWFSPNVSDVAKARNLTVYSSGTIKEGTLEGKITLGDGSLGNLIESAEEEPVSLGTALTSTVAKQTFEQKIANSIIMYTGSSSAYVGSKTRMIDKYNKKVVPKIIDDCTMLPVRFIAENMGITLNWDNKTQIMTMVRDGVTIEMQIGSKYMKVDGKVIELQAAPQIIYDRTMVPLRAIADAFNIPIYWKQDGKNGLIIIGETCQDLGTDYTVVGTLFSKLKIK